MIVDFLLSHFHVPHLGFSGRYSDFSLRWTLLVTLLNLRRSSVLSERRSYLILYIQVQECKLVAGIFCVRKWDGCVYGDECKALFVESDSVGVFLDSDVRKASSTATSQT